MPGKSDSGNETLMQRVHLTQEAKKVGSGKHGQRKDNSWENVCLRAHWEGSALGTTSITVTGRTKTMKIL
jgi:hypothetical protein